MATKIEQSSLETERVQAEGSVPASSALASNSPKISMFGKKKGFVIPKNKLSGSLVPIIRSGSKSEATDGSKDETSKQTQRKTKWGVDLMQDTSVRRSRMLAYQTRIEQITKQLESGVLEYEDDQDLQSATTIPSMDSTCQVDKQDMIKFLELERQEAIGECIRLNPNYKAPPGYKPVLREAKVPVPLKAYPSINFVSLILGPDSSTKKRLEEETGAKIRIHGRKAESGEVEVNQLDNNEARDSYEELYVHIMAETYEKVDAAVALVELLVTPVSGKIASTDTPVSGDVIVSDQNSVMVQGHMIPLAPGNLGIHPGPPEGPYQPYGGPWQPSNFLMQPSYVYPPSSMPLTNAPSTFTPSSITSTFNAPRLMVIPAASGMVVQVPMRSSPPVQVPPHPPSHLGPGQPYQPFASALPQPVSFPAGQPPSAASTRSAFTAMQLPPRPVLVPPNAGVNSASESNPLPLGAPPGWLPSRVTLPLARPTHMTAMSPRGIPFSPRPVSSVTQPLHPTVNNVSNLPGGPSLGLQTSQMPLPSSVSPIIPSPMSAQPFFSAAIRPAQPPLTVSPSAPTMVSLPTQAPRPLQVSPAGSVQTVQQILPPPNMVPSTAQAATTRGRPPVPMLSPPAAASTQPEIAQSILSTPRPAQVVPVGQRLAQGAVMPLQPSPPAVSTAFPSLPSANVLPLVLKPLRPSSSDFTFQPQKPQTSVSQSETWPRPSPQINSPMPAPPLMQQLPSPQQPSFRPAVPDLPQPIGTAGFTRPHIPPSNQIALQSPTQASVFGSSPNIAQPQPQVGPPRLLNTAFPSTPPNSAATQPSNAQFHGSAPFPPGNVLQVRNSSQIPMGRPAGFMVPHLQTNASPGFRPMAIPSPTPSSLTQVYDPFSPTSVSMPQSQQGGGAGKAGIHSRKPETDAEYEDLMASVGVE